MLRSLPAGCFLMFCAAWLVACDDDPAQSAADASSDAADTGDDSGLDGATDGADASDTTDAVDESGTDVADGGDVTEDAVEDTPDADAETGDVVEASNCNPLAVSEECLFPYPSLFFETPDESSPTGVRLALHNDVVTVPPNAPDIDFTAFNAADGVSPVSPILVHWGVDVDPDQLIDEYHGDDSAFEDAPVVILNAETHERVLPILTEMDQNSRTGPNEGRHAFIIRPLSPMAMGTRHIVVIRNTLRDAEGGELPSSPAFEALRDGTASDDPRVEAVRDHFDDLFAVIEDAGIERDELLLAWDFSVASQDFLLGSVLSMRSEALAIVAEDGVSYTIGDVSENPNENVALLVEGTFEVPTYLNEDNVFEYDEAHHPLLQETSLSFPFTMIVPPVAVDGDPLPLVVMGHGIFGSGERFLTDNTALEYIQPIANDAGAILIATDWIGLSDPDLELITSEVLPDLNRIRLVTDRLQQSLINNLVLTELARGELASDEDVVVSDGPLVDPERIYYFGGSLGGIQGSSFVALSPVIERAVFAVPGCTWSAMINRSTVFAPLKQVADLVYPDPLTQQAFITIVQGFFDHSDPVNVSHLMFRDPLEDAPENRLVVLQEAIGDALVPNLTTRLLARSMGVAQLIPNVETVYGLPTETSPTTESVLSQLSLPDHLETYRPGTENTLPEEDNNVHFDAVVQDANLAQLRELLLNGEIEQFCDGACDPD